MLKLHCLVLCCLAALFALFVVSPRLYLILCITLSWACVKGSGFDNKDCIYQTGVRFSAAYRAPTFLSAHASWYTSSADTIPSFTQCLPLGCIVFVFLFRYSLISIYSVEKNSTRTAVVVIPNNLWWNAPMFYHGWWRTKAALMRTSINNPLFSSNHTTWLIDVHLTCSEENILEVLHIVPLDLQFRHMQRHVRWHVNIFHTHIHQRHSYIMDVCLKWVMMDAMARNRRTTNALISVSTTVFGENASWALNAHSTKVSSLKSWLRYFRSFS